MYSIEDSKTRWEFFQKHQWVSPEFSLSPIFRSWQRCVKQMSAYDWSRPHIASGFTLASLKRRNESVINCTVTVVEDTYDLLREEKLLLLATDDNGCVMFSIGHHELESRMEALGIKVGCFLAEDKVGTNAVSFAIDTNMPSEVFAGDHFKRELHNIATVAAPIIDTFGELRGTIMIVKNAEEYNRENLVIASSCAKEVSLLLHIKTEQDNMNRLQSAHSAALDHMDDGVISWDKENIISYVSQQTEKLLEIHSNDLLERDIFNLIRFSPSILNSIKKGEMVRHKQTTFEVDGRFIEAIITYRYMSDGTHLLFLHPIDKIKDLSFNSVSRNSYYSLDTLPLIASQTKHLIKIARRAIKSQTPIFITGEEGVGKSDLAWAIHNESTYKDGPFVVLNCLSKNPYELLRDVLGFDEGEGQLSKFELAKNGTLYIENIEHLGLDLQAAILSLLKTGFISRSDSQKMISVKFQLITSTTKDINNYISEGLFSRHLYYDLSINEVNIPPIRGNQEDIKKMILDLVYHYNLKQDFSINVTTEAMDKLIHYNWPGNYSELRHVMEKMLLNRSSLVIDIDDIPNEIKLYSPNKDLRSTAILTLEEVEKQTILQAWKVFDGCMQETAKALNIGRTTLWRKMKKYELTTLIEAD